MPPTLTRTVRKYAKNKGAKKLKRYIRRKRGARAQSHQLVKTNDRITSLANKVRGEVNKWGLYREVSTVALGGLTIFQMQPAATAGTYSGSWDRCFAQSDAAQNTTRARLGNLKLVMQFTSFTEVSGVNFSVFHVRLNPKNAEYMVRHHNTALSGAGAGHHVMAVPDQFIRGAVPALSYSAGCNGDVMLNPDYFITKKRWHFKLSARSIVIGSPAHGPISSTYKRIEYSFPLGYTLGRGSGSWQTVSADDDTAAQLKNYLLIFTDNSTLDLENPAISLLMQCTATGLG